MALDTRWKNPASKDPEQLYRWAQDLITELRKGAYLSNAISNAGFIKGPNPTTLHGFARYADITGTALEDHAATVSPAEALFAATKRVLGRNTAGGGTGEEVSLTQLLDWIGSPADGDILYRTGGAWARLAVGSNGNVLTVASSLPSWAASSSSKAADQQVFAGSGTWNKPAGFGAKAYALIEVWGAGGGGGRSGATGTSGGGGGGGYNRRFVLLSSLGATETVTVGGAGAAGGANSTNGSAGGNTTFGTWLTGFGGGGGGFGGASASNNPGWGGLPTLQGPTNTVPFNVSGIMVVPWVELSGVLNVLCGEMGGCGAFNKVSGCTTAPVAAASSVYGGGGGGGKNNATLLAAGTSFGGGNGGASGSAGTAPGGGGGGNVNAAAGAGAAGKCTVTVFDGA